MRYRLSNGDRLIVSVDETEPEEIVFHSREFDDIAKATPEEVAAVLDRSGALEASVTEEGTVVLATESEGGHTSIDVDLTESTAAPALGLAASASRASGSGPRAARLVSATQEPYRLPAGAQLSLLLDGSRRRISFDDEDTGKDLSAAEAAKAVNAKARRRVAYATRDGRLMLQSPTIGAGSRLEVQPGGGVRGKTDASEALGLVGEATLDEPHPAAPAMLELSGRQVELRVSNLTAMPIEMHFPTGIAVLPPHGSLPLTGGEMAHLPLQRLVEEGALAVAAVAAAPADEAKEDGA
jgi:hypothetical protein